MAFSFSVLGVCLAASGRGPVDSEVIMLELGLLLGFVGVIKGERKGARAQRPETPICIISSLHSGP